MHSDPSNIKIEHNSALLEVSPLVWRKKIGETIDGHVEEYQELQFQVKNITTENLVKVSTELEYRSASGKFEGFDRDDRFEVLEPNKTHNFSVQIEAEKNHADAQLLILARKQRMGEKIPPSITFGFFVVGIILFLYLEFFGRN